MNAALGCYLTPFRMHKPFIQIRIKYSVFRCSGDVGVLLSHQSSPILQLNDTRSHPVIKVRITRNYRHTTSLILAMNVSLIITGIITTIIWQDLNYIAWNKTTEKILSHSCLQANFITYLWVYNLSLSLNQWFIVYKASTKVVFSLNTLTFS